MRLRYFEICSIKKRYLEMGMQIIVDDKHDAANFSFRVSDSAPLSTATFSNLFATASVFFIFFLNSSMSLPLAVAALVQTLSYGTKLFAISFQ